MKQEKVAAAGDQNAETRPTQVWFDQNGQFELVCAEHVRMFYIPRLLIIKAQIKHANPQVCFSYNTN